MFPATGRHPLVPRPCSARHRRKCTSGRNFESMNEFMELEEILDGGRSTTV